jgi:hypothetical protein
MCKIISVLIFIVVLIGQLDAARILGIIPYFSKSHSILGQALFIKLAERGHEVSVILILNIFGNFDETIFFRLGRLCESIPTKKSTQKLYGHQFDTKRNIRVV